MRKKECEDENLGFWSAKRIFAFPKLKTKDVCVIGLLIALTAVLSFVSGYLRIGNISKLSISFVCVFVAAYMYGGTVGAIVCAAADVMSFAINPVAAFMPQLTAIEFIYGFIYGFLFYKTDIRYYFLNLIICDVILSAVNIFVKTAILSASFLIPYKALLISRFPMCALQAALIFAVIVLIRPFLGEFKKGIAKR